MNSQNPSVKRNMKEIQKKWGHFFAHHFKDFEKKMENVGQPPPPLYENSVSTSPLAMSVRALFLEIS
jgi:hypothetical protein